MGRYLSYCFILFPSVFPTSSASAVLNHNAAESFSGDKWGTSMSVSGASCRASRLTASSAYKQRIKCLIHFVQVDEKFRKYTTRVEHSFRIANGLEERLRDTTIHVNN